jgi:hypothetical protein
VHFVAFFARKQLAFIIASAMLSSICQAASTKRMHSAAFQVAHNRNGQEWVVAAPLPLSTHHSDINHKVYCYLHG